MRFEPPDSRNRWDSTLFVVQAEEDLPYEDICAALFQGKALPPNMSTQNVSVLWLGFNFISLKL